MSPELPWLIVGYGRVGQTLGLLAAELGADVAATWNRTAHAAERASVPSPNPHHGALPEALETCFDKPHLVWLTVVDDAIPSVFAVISDHLHPDSIIVHTSGSLPSTVLADETELPVASLHPLQAVSDPRAAVERLVETYWTVEGDDRAIDYLRQLLAPAQILPTRIEPDKKTLYHASAVTAANLLISLFDAAIAIAEQADINAETARKMLVQLGRSSLDNLDDQPPSTALTGPTARGDYATIDEHRRALKALDDDSLLEIYDLLTRRALENLT